ncbi:hypothetical protein GTW52_30615 [Streptomyces sp. SID8358]|nr:hypothetical protein [Streptomyces sp. SID8358]
MNLRSMSLALVALLSTAGCVSVPAGPDGPAPGPSGHSRNMPAAQASTATAPPPVHDALGKAEGEPEERSGKRRKQNRAPDRQAAPAAPARPEAPGRPRHPVTVRPDARRTGTPPRTGPASRTAAPQRTYDMRTVCAAGRGVASTDILDLCRSTYGR